MKRTTVILNKYGRNAQSHHLKPLLGLTVEQKLPNAGLEPQFLNAAVAYNDKPIEQYVKVKVWIAPLKAGRKVHRVRAQCPWCHKEVSAGRLFQHTC
jgi:hypothetical protein